MPEDLPVDSDHDIRDSDTDNTSDNMGVDEPPEAGSMRGEAQTHKVNAPGETSVGRQRELAAGPSDNSAQKRQRIQLLEDLEKSVKNIMSATFAHGESAVSDLCNRETLKKIIGDLDESWTAHISRKFRRFAKRCDKRAEKLTKTKSRCERDPDVAEIFSPLRMTRIVQKLGMKAGFALDLTTCDEQGVPYDLSKLAMQQKSLEFLEKVKPTMLISSTPCAMFSTMQNANVGKMKVEDVEART